MSKSALVFGASGVTGWSFINEILSDYPAKGTWKRAHALSNRPITLSQALWPEDPRLNMVSGVDLLAHSQESLEKELVEKIPDVAEITHVYYFAYKAGMDVKKEIDEALEMFSKAVKAVDKLCPALEFIVLQIGTKIYGCHLRANLSWYESTIPPGSSAPALPSPPLSESAPPIPSPHAENLFYHAQIDFITKYAKDKKWSFIETRTDLVIGFVPNKNYYSIATSVAFYLSVWKAVHGEGAKCPFPGTVGTWKALSNDASSDMIAHQTIHLTLSPSTTKGAVYNLGDSKTPYNWEVKWPVLCSYFGLEATEPLAEPIDMRKFINDNMDTWLATEQKYGLQSGHIDSGRGMQISEHFLMTTFDFDRHFDLTKIYSTGFTEERTPKEAWWAVFDRMRKAKLIP
ncbi:hypothetical protein GGP41_004586 [Bipolaris sorokiniana]|uniref:PRISE-like Rossmann-fold domain-containing protein n=2 Tax=Cochliobolus sativus TaxID=45130 RepID=A0A8H5ZA46_COCSA|nr:uncharacterized protein COCSADRAFT_32152 [Bipolaris sorokiniana ND90Pr]EMD69427.1 hypothetical protein COCSADRAFT_32152 [Bipolaris sorokiniana ND90Pr]KAF5846533.1 hypothetical protein GGP41_004586 [Bipolaris sorokiniana]